MKRPNYLLPAVLLLLCLPACTTYNYYTAAINKTNLSNYQTFAWMPQANSDNKNMTPGVADATIKDVTTQNLVSKGLQLNRKNPDLIVNYTAIVGRGTRTNYYSAGYYGYPGWGWGPGWGFGFGWGWGGRWGWARPYYYYGSPFAYGPTYSEKEHYKEGTLIIDLIDSHTHKIVWRGFGVGEVHKNPQKTIEDLPKVVDGVLSQLQLSPGQAEYYRRS